MTAGAAFCAPVRRFFENRLSSFLGWISFPLYLVQAAVIYAFSLHGLDLLASLGFAPAMQRWIVGAVTIPIAILFAVMLCPINDAAVALSRRFGASFAALCEEIDRRRARRGHPQASL
jgi:peptidoglycan/LPS O-acetylase OafA/YrhL